VKPNTIAKKQKREDNVFEKISYVIRKFIVVLSEYAGSGAVKNGWQY